MNEEFKKRLKEFTESYRVIKELMIYGEEIDPQRKTDLQAAGELRAAFDHMMRSFGFDFGLIENEDKEYVEKNFNKAMGHLIRAGYDTLDWMSISLRSNISRELENISALTISQVYPDYYNKDKEKIVCIEEGIAKARNKKDVCNDTKNFMDYVTQINSLKEIYDRVLKKKVPLLEYEKKTRNKEIKGYLIAAAITAVITLIITKLFSGFN